MDVGRWASIAWRQLILMELSIWVAVIVVSVAFFVSLPYWKNWGKKLPPGPPSWPLLGSLMYLGGELHQVLWELAKKYGPVMRVGLGQHMLIVVSSAEVAEELMRKRDAEFSNRAARTIQRSAAKYIGIDAHDIAFADYTPELRLLRKFATTDLFTSARLAASAKIRRQEVGIMVQSICEQKGEPIVVKDYLHTMTMNSICQLLFSKRYYGKDVPVTADLQSFKQVVTDVFDNVGKLNLADLIPALRWFDLQGIEAQWKRIRPRAEKVFGLIIDEHRQNHKAGGRPEDADERDFVDVLLSPQGNEKVPDKSIIGVLFDMILGGTDTTATTIEWCMVEVVRHPELVHRLQEELDRVVGAERQVEETDFPHLPFLQAFIKETFRLHLSVPITLPRLNDHQTTLGGYDIPALSTIFVNSYAIAHDPKYWENPFEFMPDRFLTNNVGLSGADYQLLPFGSGRRRCVGVQLGLNSVSRAVAAMVHALDWAPKPGLKPVDIDLVETYSIVLRKRYPLEAVATPRPAASVYVS